jgi:hypothetical protein
MQSFSKVGSLYLVCTHINPTPHRYKFLEASKKIKSIPMIIIPRKHKCNLIATTSKCNLTKCKDLKQCSCILCVYFPYKLVENIKLVNGFVVV